jgi:hypothetical protein
MAAASALQAGFDECESDLCRRCQAFDIQAFSRDKAPWRGYRIGDIAKSATLGCSCCAYLACGLDNAGYAIYDNQPGRFPMARWVHFRVLRASRDPSSESELDDTGLNITHLQVHSTTTGEFLQPNESPFLEFHVVAEPGDPAAMSGDISGRHSSRDKGSEESIDLIKSWLATCIDNHSMCSQSLSGQQIATPTPLPTRCLEITRNVVAQNSLRIRLVETAGQTGSYTTLSHRWPAPPKQLQGATTLTNLADRLSGSETLESKLPRHFLDTCMLTFRLGYEYIWIDAVCIIQGKMDDWASEASRMASYYQNSKLTIAVTYGDDTKGFLDAETPENSRLMIRLPYRPRPGAIALEPSFFYLIPSDSHSNTDYQDYVVRGELLSRGWVTQEWILSRRILCYTPTSV